MSIKKRSGPVRQLSLPQASQRSLQKRSSVELNDRKFDKDNNNNNTTKKTTPPPKTPELGTLLISASSITKQNGDAEKKSRSKERSTTAGRGRGRGRGTWGPPPRPLRLAWGERGQNSQSQEGPTAGVQVVAERCKGLSRPQTAGPAVARESALGYNRNTILISRKQFAERIRQAWRDREFTKQNLEIYLASPGNAEDVSPRVGYNVVDVPSPGSPYSVISTELRSAESELDAALGWDPELGANVITDSDDEDERIVPFSEQISKYKAETHPPSGSGTPTTGSSSFESTDSTLPTADAWANSQSQLPASTRRQNFRNACQKAIDKTPTQPQSARRANPPRTPKWAAPSQSRSFEGAPTPEQGAYRGYERNIKSAPPPKRRLKAVRRKLKPFYGNLSASDDDSGAKGGPGALTRRRAPFSNGPKEVETMISLLSPTDSETETDVPDPLALLQASEPFPVSPNVVHPPPPPPPQHTFFHGTNGSATTRSLDLKTSREEVREIKPPPLLFLRKSPKPVSFKLLGPAVKSHSALFAGRRSEPPISENGTREIIPHALRTGPITDRLELTHALDHKKLARTKTNELLRPEGEGKDNERSTNGQDPQKLQSILISSEAAEVDEDTESPCEREGVTAITLSIGGSPGTTIPVPLPRDDPETASSEPQFNTAKEKECWHLFRKMVDKGISVSFDTVLRGMLTPTEYRLRKASEDSFT